MRKRGDPIDSTEPAVSHGEREGAPDSGPQSVYGRWSRRKARARAAPATARADVPVSGLSARGPQGPTHAAIADPARDAVDAPRERVLTDADMPALEALGEDDDYSGFLSSGVSEQLRLKALRKLFTGSKFNVTDGLDDYADDFTKFEPLGDIITSDMRHRIEVEAERARQAAEEEAREQIASGTGADAGTEAGVASDVPAEVAEPAAVPDASDAAGPADDRGRERSEAPAARHAPPAPDASVASSVAQSTTAPAPRVRDDG